MGEASGKAHGAALAFLDAVKGQIVEDRGEVPPDDTIFCIALIQLAQAQAAANVTAVFPGFARALASIAVADRVSRKELMAALGAAMRPTFQAAHRIQNTSQAAH